MFFTDGPERYSAPPVETWMMPSAPASANPLSAALRVWEDDTLIAGNAKAPAFAASSISAYFSGVAMGTGGLLGVTTACDSTLVATDRSPNPRIMTTIRPRTA